MDTSCVFNAKLGKYRVAQCVVAQREPDRRDVEGGDAETWFYIHPSVEIHNFQCTSQFPMTCKSMSIEYRVGMGWLLNDVNLGSIGL